MSSSCLTQKHLSSFSIFKLLVNGILSHQDNLSDLTVDDLLKKFSMIKAALLNLDGKTECEQVVIRHILQNLYFNGGSKQFDYLNVVLLSYLLDFNISYTDIVSKLSMFKFKGLGGKAAVQIGFRKNKFFLDKIEGCFPINNIANIVSIQDLDFSDLLTTLNDFIINEEIGMVFSAGYIINLQSYIEISGHDGFIVAYDQHEDIELLRNIFTYELTTKFFDIDGIYFFCLTDEFFTNLNVNLDLDLSVKNRPINKNAVFLKQRYPIKVRDCQCAYTGRIETPLGNLYVFFISLKDFNKEEFETYIENFILELDFFILHNSSIPKKLKISYSRQRKVVGNKIKCYISVLLFKYVLVFLNQNNEYKSDIFVYVETFGIKNKTISNDISKSLNQLNSFIRIEDMKSISIDLALTKESDIAMNTSDTHTFLSVQTDKLNKLGFNAHLYVTLFNKNIVNLNSNLIKRSNEKVIQSGIFEKINFYNPLVNHICNKKLRFYYPPVDSMKYILMFIKGDLDIDNLKSNSIFYHISEILLDENINEAEYRCEITTNFRNLIPVYNFLNSFISTDSNFVVLNCNEVKNDIKSKIEVYFDYLNLLKPDINTLYKMIVYEIILVSYYFKGNFSNNNFISNDFLNNLQELKSYSFCDNQVLIDKVNQNIESLVFEKRICLIRKAIYSYSKWQNSKNKAVLESFLRNFYKRSITCFLINFLDEYLRLIENYYKCNILSEINSLEKDFTKKMECIEINELIREIFELKYDFLKTLKQVIFFQKEFFWRKSSTIFQYILKYNLSRYFSSSNILYFPKLLSIQNYKIVRVVYNSDSEYLFTEIDQNIIYNSDFYKNRYADNSRLSNWKSSEIFYLIIGYKLYKSVYKNISKIDVMKMVEVDLRFRFFMKRKHEMLYEKLKNIIKLERINKNAYSNILYKLSLDFNFPVLSGDYSLDRLVNDYNVTDKSVKKAFVRLIGELRFSCYIFKIIKKPESLTDFVYDNDNVYIFKSEDIRMYKEYAFNSFRVINNRSSYKLLSNFYDVFEDSTSLSIFEDKEVAAQKHHKNNNINKIIIEKIKEKITEINKPKLNFIEDSILKDGKRSEIFIEHEDYPDFDINNTINSEATNINNVTNSSQLILTAEEERTFEKALRNLKSKQKNFTARHFLNEIYSSKRPLISVAVVYLNNLSCEGILYKSDSLKPKYSFLR